MNENILNGNWNELKGSIQKKWGKLTGDEIERIQGDYNSLVGQLQKSYGESKEKAEENVNDFLKEIRNNKN